MSPLLDLSERTIPNPWKLREGLACRRVTEQSDRLHIHPGIAAALKYPRPGLSLIVSVQGDPGKLQPVHHCAVTAEAMEGSGLL